VEQVQDFGQWHDRYGQPSFGWWQAPPARAADRRSCCGLIPNVHAETLHVLQLAPGVIEFNLPLTSHRGPFSNRLPLAKKRKSGHNRPMKITALKPLPKYRLQLSFADGATGIVDLSEKVGRGVFAIWKNPGVFEQVKIGEFGQPSWPGDVDLCPDTLYRMATGQLPVECAVTREVAHA
jgi:hypothetical protein